MKEAQKRQKDELTSLRSIFGKDVLDLKKSKGTSSFPLELQINVRPQSEIIQVSCDLYVNCGPNYPITTPQSISLCNCKGLAKDVQNKLNEKLLEVAYKLKGQEVIYALVDYIKTFLDERNESLYHEMVSKTEEEAERKKEPNARLRQANQSRYIQEEIERKQMVCRQESKMRKESFTDLQSDNTQSQGTGN